MTLMAGPPGISEAGFADWRRVAPEITSRRSKVARSVAGRCSKASARAGSTLSEKFRIQIAEGVGHLGLCHGFVASPIAHIDFG